MRFAALLVLLTLPSSSSLTLIGRWYAPGTTVSSVPVARLPAFGEFAVDYQGRGRLSLIGSIETRLYRDDDRPFGIGSVYYHIGTRYQVHPRLLLELKHGSWHNIDSAGPTEMYNRLGVEVKLP